MSSNREDRYNRRERRYARASKKRMAKMRQMKRQHEDAIYRSLCLKEAERRGVDPGVLSSRLHRELKKQARRTARETR